MINYKWTISDVEATNYLITCAKYHIIATLDDLSVATEGYWFFKNQVINTPFLNVTEQMVADWVDEDCIKDGVSVIKSRLEEQLALLVKSKSVVPPWKPQVFTPELT